MGFELATWGTEVKCSRQLGQNGDFFEHSRISTIGLVMMTLYPQRVLSPKGVLFFLSRCGPTHNISIFALNMWSSCTFYHDFRIQDVVEHLFYHYFRNHYVNLEIQCPSEKIETPFNFKYIENTSLSILPPPPSFLIIFPPPPSTLTICQFSNFNRKKGLSSPVTSNSFPPHILGLKL